MPARKAARKPATKTTKRAARAKRPARPANGAKAASQVSAITDPAVRNARSGSAVRSITPFLWFDGNVEQAARFYVSLLPDSRIEGLSPMGGSFVLAGQRFMGLNGGPEYRFTPAVSFFVVCKDQKEVDRLWTALEKGGKPSRCGWIDDKFGLTWQIVPEAFLRMTADPDPKKVQAVFQAMMGMVKMDVAGLQAAYDSA
jgi:predicted 3-demethylubiquinone-9 3-methyltransferase (glyoxalase superfamily)